MILNDTLRSGKMSPRISQKLLNRVTTNSGSGSYCASHHSRKGLARKDGVSNKKQIIEPGERSANLKEGGLRISFGVADHSGLAD